MNALTVVLKSRGGGGAIESIFELIWLLIIHPKLLIVVIAVLGGLYYIMGSGGVLAEVAEETAEVFVEGGDGGEE